MNKKIILFDWDDTLFSKNLYKKNLTSNLAKICEITEEEAAKTDDEYFNNLAKSGDFKIEDFLKTFENKFGKKINLEDFNTDKLGIYSKSLFGETVEVLEKMKDEYTFGIYTQGFESLQKLKIKYSGIENYFDKDLIFIDRDKTRSEFMAKLPTGAMVIDDKKEVIEALRKLRMDLDLVWINRKDDDHFDGVLTIKSLEELV
jgi:FMN phosphatase YigB (HAD superfamily)